MATTVNELISELQDISSKLTSGEIPIKFRKKKVEVNPLLYGENGDYWCNLCIDVIEP